MPGPLDNIQMDVVSLFCNLDSANMAQIIDLSDYMNAEKEIALSHELIKENIVHELLQLCGSLDEAYRHITKYLFTGENAAKASHKQMYWRIFGDIAIHYLDQNLCGCSVCPDCGEKIPAWDKSHLCPVNTKGLVSCIDCGIVTNRTNSRQCRCDACQIQYRKTQERIRVRKYRNQQGR